VGGGVLAVDDGGFDGGEFFLFQHVGQFGFGEAEPGVGVEFAGLVEAVLVEVEDDEGAAGFEDAVCFAEGAGGMFGVVEGLGEEGEIDGGVVDGDFLDVAEAVFEVGEVVFLGEFGAELDHLGGVIEGDDFLCALGEELGEGAFARAEVGDGLVVEDLEEGFGETFPGAAGDVLAAELSGQFVEVGAGLVLSLAEDVGEGAGVLGAFGEFLGGAGGDVEEVGGGQAGVDVVLSGT